ncbi:MAG: hypothetical protein JWO94_953, partial [Verrucomicrobiaceae bacterium]|nr:hypothetical protein [Verrucomicrobiaceae bacterium]
MIRRFCLLAIAFSLPLHAADKKPSKSKAKGEDKKASALPYEVAEFVENDFPFFSTTLDARELGEGFPKDNVTPRGLVLNLGHNLWACFDVDLLRMSCIWQGEPGKAPITLVALAPRSYKDPGQKTKDGQDDLPKPVGKVWLVNGIYPGWQVGTEATLADPREPGPSKNEVGRGALPDAGLKAVRLTEGGVRLEYQVGGTLVKESIAAVVDAGHLSIARTLKVAPTPKPLIFIAGEITQGERIRSKLPVPEQGTSESKLNITKLEASDKEQVVEMGFDLGAVNDKSGAPSGRPAHWPQTLSTKGVLSHEADAYVLDDIALPTTNPWKRNVRLADIAFLDDQGHAAAVTMDGDVWTISGLNGNLENVQWKRFTSGFHEPMSIVARKEKGGLPSLFVYDRNGIWKIVDTTGSGEADVHEMFCDLFSQTGETREFPNSMKLGPDGSLYISKGGQQGTTLGKDNGKVLRIAPDGKSYQTVAWGLRQPFI